MLHIRKKTLKNINRLTFKNIFTNYTITCNHCRNQSTSLFDDINYVLIIEKIKASSFASS